MRLVSAMRFMVSVLVLMTWAVVSSALVLWFVS